MVSNVGDINQVSDISTVKLNDVILASQTRIAEWANKFLQAKLVEGLSDRTLYIYNQQLGHLLRFLDGQVIGEFSELKPENIREYFLWHKTNGHNRGGQHLAFRVLRTFLLWYEREEEPAGWKNPIRKIKAPKLPSDILEPVELDDVFAMARTCDKTYLGLRDRAILLCLLDTGARAREFLALDLDDINLSSGQVLIRTGKGGKARFVFLGETSLQALKDYLAERSDNQAAAWLTIYGERLGYGGLRALLEKRAQMAGISNPGAHDFRRAFAVNMLRNDVDVVLIARIMGHSNLKTIQRYLRLVTNDLQNGFKQGGPVDNANKKRKR